MQQVIFFVGDRVSTENRDLTTDLQCVGEFAVGWERKKKKSQGLFLSCTFFIRSAARLNCESAFLRRLFLEEKRKNDLDD